ncbi:MAG: PAS domain S-box protein [Helicobacteraceae bacterium]|nr:PAS domain S-box protein [Helicobacteraceae bacterium]
MKESLQFLKTILDVIPIAIYVLDEDFKFLNCNSAFAQQLKQPKEEIIGASWSKFIPDYLSYIYDKKDKQIRDGTNQKYREILEIDGYRAKIMIFHRAALFENEVFDGLVGVMEDVTSKEEYEFYMSKKIESTVEEVREKERELREEGIQKAKYMAIGKLSAGITHEINTPLTYLKGNVEMLDLEINYMDDSDAKHRMKHCSNSIVDGIFRISNIIESMREVTQRTSAISEKTDIYHTLVTSLILVQHRTKLLANVYINNHLFTPDDTQVKSEFISKVQQQRVEQAWIIILNNSLDELEKLEESSDSYIYIDLNIVDENIVIHIRDNAGGIDEELLPTIFDTFVSNKFNGGLGIGLDIARNIIEDQRGSVRAYNDKSKSEAIFEVKLPLLKE